MSFDNGSKRISRILRAGAVGMVLTAAISVSGVAQACLSTIAPEHTLALAVRTLQSDMMVAAMSCNARDRRNAVVVKYRSDFQKYGAELKAYFTKLDGSNATREINTYVTDLANYGSLRHAQDNTAFCGGVESAFSALLIDKEKTFKRVALAYAMRVSPSLKQEITLAATESGCDVVAQGTTVAAGGITILK